MGTTFTQFAPRRALRAARILSADPDDLPQVFTIIESLSGNTLQRIWQRLTESPSGRRILEQQPDIVDQLVDREALARFPEGTLARAYLDFVEKEKISPAGIREAGKKGMTNERPVPPELEYVHARMRDTHDLWHAAIGYRGDVLGEVALLAFIFAQTKNPAVALIIVIGLLKTYGAPEARAVIYEGYRRGKKANWLPGIEWESLLALPVEEVRQKLSLDGPPVYNEVRSWEMKTAKAAAA